MLNQNRYWTTCFSWTGSVVPYQTGSSQPADDDDDGSPWAGAMLLNLSHQAGSDPLRRFCCQHRTPPVRLEAAHLETRPLWEREGSAGTAADSAARTSQTEHQQSERVQNIPASVRPAPLQLSFWVSEEENSFKQRRSHYSVRLTRAPGPRSAGQGSKRRGRL